MTGFYKHAILGPSTDPGLSKALLLKRLGETGLDYLDLGNGYVDVIVDMDETRVRDVERVLNRVANKTGVVWNIPYDTEIFDEVGLHHTLRWSRHPWGIRVESDEDMVAFAQTLEGAVQRHYPHAKDHVLIDLPETHLQVLRDQAGIVTDPGEIDWEALFAESANEGWIGSAFSRLVDPPATKAQGLKAWKSHEAYLKLLADAGIPAIEITPGYIEFKVKGRERKDQLVLLGIMAQVERQTEVAWQNPEFDPQWATIQGRDHTLEVSFHEAFLRVESEEAWDYAKTLPGAEVHAWPDGTVRGVDFWYLGEEDRAKSLVDELTKWAGPPVK